MVPGKQFSQLTHKEAQIMMAECFFYRATVPFARWSRHIRLEIKRLITVIM